MTRIDITVVVCTYNRAHLLRDALTDLTSQRTSETSFSYEIVVVDDASTDDTQQVIKRFAGSGPVEIRSVAGDGSGVARAHNKGVAAAAGEWIAVFDDDQRVSDDWLENLWRAALGQHVDYVGGPIILDLPEGVRLGPACRAIYGEYPDYRHRHVPRPLPPGGNWMARRSVFDQIGLYDESILTGGYDLDLLSRAVAADVKFGWAPAAVVKHVIPEERLDPGRIRDYCRQAGLGRAFVDFRRAGKPGIVGESAMRVGKMLVGNLPVWLWAAIARSTSLVLDCKARVWVTSGYMQGALINIWPWAAGRLGIRADQSFRTLRS